MYVQLAIVVYTNMCKSKERMTIAWGSGIDDKLQQRRSNERK